ncbi:flagellar basal-body rod protein FlgF [Ketogulonicigenium robustum]|uniref:Flagellar basal-body rod protein FlgF n=1 Tax=Ketogulonicigenium robustum TaxID=92947 RepID=A0A1W6P1M1_9RHOB|nr:flagellar hook-basal body complex protein [Ketogulonicigenium robustum]ARO15408.1 flagellar basal-body rod protein FlgF [Ketogulonicigenium robustum]
MDNAGYTSLTRQSGLLHEMRAIANNIANANTTGFRAEGVAFSEYVVRLGPQTQSLSLATARVRQTDFTQGDLGITNAPYDLAIEGEGFFMIDHPDGPMLTRSGAFTLSGEGVLVTADGYSLLDAGEAPVMIPADAGPVMIGSDGTIAVGGDAIGQIGLFTPTDPNTITRTSGTGFFSDDNMPVLDGVMRQGHLENSNVNAISQIARMIEVQRAYEFGQTLADREDERIRNTIQLIKS